jgi:hypothetical protein
VMNERTLSDRIVDLWRKSLLQNLYSVYNWGGGDEKSHAALRGGYGGGGAV